MNDEFKKYAESGDYHWQLTYGPWRRRSPRLHARYDLAISALRRFMPLAGKRGIDLGCGDGVMLYKLSQTSAAVSGLDGSAEAVRLGQARLQRLGVRTEQYLTGSVYEVPAPDASYDFVTCIEVIEHLDDPIRFLREVSRILKPGGIFVCTTPNREEGQDASAVRDPYHVKEYIASELREEIGQVFGVAKVVGGYPGWLDRIYSNGTGFGLLDKTVRLAVKLAATAGLSPYGLMSRSEPGFDHGLLVGVGLRK